MINIMLVDDEVLAMDYLKNMLDWEEQGYHVVGCAANGKRALDLYEKEKPEIVISDIRMPGMDGLELTKCLKKKNPDVIVILLSAYRDFEYAQKGMQYGVSNYLLKHELSGDTLLAELERVRKQLESDSRKAKIYQKYFMNQLIYNQADADEMKHVKLGNRLFLMMLNKSSRFLQGSFQEEEWTAQELNALSEVLEAGLEDKIFYVADVQITSSNLIVLYRIENTVSKYTVNRLIEQKSVQISSRILEIPECRFHIIYSYEIRQSEISSTFRRMSKQIRYALFWELDRGYPLDELPQEDDKLIWGERIEELRDLLYEEGQNPQNVIKYLFGMTMYPQHRLMACKSLIHLLDNLLREIEEKEGVNRGIEEEKRYTIEQVRRYYEVCFTNIYEQIQVKENGKYSKTVLEMIRHIRKNYNRELSLESMGDMLQMNGVYLGQVFKKEVGITFLKYLTNLRIEEAKRLLREENSTVSETGRLVGYQTSQYFSHIFTRIVGVTPQEYKKWDEKN